MRFLFLTMEATNNSALKTAAEALRQEYGIGLDVSIVNIGLNNSLDVWQRLEAMIGTMDFVFGSMLFSEEVVRPLEHLLDKATCPVCMITSNPSLISKTTLGRFSLRKKTEQDTEKNIFMHWTGKLRPKHKHGENQRQLALVRNISRIMKHIPGKARDIHSYIAAHQFWLNGSEENMKRFLSLLIDRYIPGWKGKLPQQDPLFYPDTAICHPDAEEPFSCPAAYNQWRNARREHSPRGCVLILVMRATVLSRNMDHVEALVDALEQQGLEACIAYSGGLDFRPVIDGFIGSGSPSKLSPDVIINATGFSLVGGPAENRSEEAVRSLKKAGVTYINLIQLSFQSIRQWQTNMMGLTPLQTALCVAVTELDGAIEPHVYAGTAETSDKTIPLPGEIRSIARRVRKHVELRNIPASEKRLAIVLFNFPPNLGNAGTAAYLDVFESLWNVLNGLREKGYRVDVPCSAAELKDLLLEGNRELHGTDGNVADRLPVEEYRKLFVHYHEIETFWGDAPGELLNDDRSFHILGRSFGNIFIGQQPSFGYERDPMRLLMSKDGAPNHAFAAFYTWLEQVFKADAVLHFGTHGALEFMPGKQTGLSASCWPKRLIGSLPNFYYYCVNNPSEGAIAKRRGFATLVSYLSPPLERAGLYKGLRKLHDLVESWYKQPCQEVFTEIESLAASLELPASQPELSHDERIAFLKHELYLVEERMIPLGLHIIGRTPSPETLVDQLALLACHERPELANRSLPECINGSANLDYRRLQEESSSNRDAARKLEEVMEHARVAVRLFTGTIPEHLANSVSCLDIVQASFPVRVADATSYLQKHAGLKHTDLDMFWHFMQNVLVSYLENRELPALLDALEGRYIEPSPGSDLVRNPGILPTGRNIHSLDPFSIPSSFALQRGRESAAELLTQYQCKEGKLPESVALVLWGTDNLKSDGEGVAQALALIGAETTVDELGKVTSVRLLPLEELGRPRIDVVLNVSGIFRDLLSHQVKLLDKAVRLAASADEPESMNFIRKHVRQQALEEGIGTDKAANRVFSNAPGSYGANINHLVESSSWQEEQELADTFINRKSFAVNASGEWEESPEVLTSALRNVSLTFQNIDSYEIGISDIDHYYEYLGGISKTVERLSRKKPEIMVGDINGFGKKQNICSLEKMVSIESRTKLLNPKWYEAMLEHGYEGVREIEAHLSNTYGWSATASAVRDWTYEQFNETYLKDPEMLERLRNMNIHATAGMTRRLLEAHSRGFWNADSETIEELRELYESLETRMEGAENT